MKNLSSLCVALGVWLALAGCSTTPEQTPAASTVQPAALPPNYDTPENEFVPLKIGQLSPEFLDEQAGKYVTFQAKFMQCGKGAIVGLELGRGAAYFPDMMHLMVGAPDIMSGRTVNVIYSEKDRELGRPSTEWTVQTPITVFAYVLPAKQKARTKTAAGSQFGGFKVPTLLLIKAAAKPTA